LDALRAAWERVPADERERLCADLPADLVKPLLRVLENSTSSVADECVDSLARAYRGRTDAGVEELALQLPHDLLWAIARIAYGDHIAGSGPPLFGPRLFAACQARPEAYTSGSM
jgi:hypothetical protein